MSSESQPDDQTERRQRDDRIHAPQHYDQLTELPNRHKLEVEVRMRLAQAQLDGACGWLLYLDVDRFKLVNEACGYGEGDRLVVEIASCLQQTLQADDLFARFGGDKFAVLIAALSPAAAVRQAQALIAAVKAYRFDSDGRSFALGLSVGAAPLDANAADVSTVLRQAEASCRAAKHRGGDRVILYRLEDAQLASSEEDLGWGEEILRALDEDRFELFAQRIVSIDGHQPPSYEILLRLRQRDGEFILPGRFFPAARRYGLMTTLDRRVLERVLEQCRSGIFEQYPCGYISVNLSALSVGDESFTAFLLPALARSGVAPEKLRFEITESEVLSNIETAQDTVERLRALGFRVMLDDFGSGYTSFSDLRALKVDGLKIDNSYIYRIDQDAFSQAVVESICGLCAKLGLEVVAEGVEDEAALAMLRRFKVKNAQGWLFHRAEPLLKALQNKAAVEAVGQGR